MDTLALPPVSSRWRRVAATVGVALFLALLAALAPPTAQAAAVSLIAAR